MRNFAITGVGMYVPEKILTNEEIESWNIGSLAKWIEENTGVKERRIAGNGQVTSDLAALAARKALENAKIKPEEIDLLVVSTITPDFLLPQTSSIVKRKIGASNAACFDIQAGCAGFVFALINAVNYGILNNEINNILVIGADMFSKVTDWGNKKTCSTTGDGAGAFVLQESKGSYGIRASHIYSESMESEIYGYVPIYYGNIPIDSKSYFNYIGRYLAEKAKEHIPFVVDRLLEKVSWTIEDVNLFIFPQGNKNIILDISKQLNIPVEKLHMTMHKYGYTYNACIPIAVSDMLCNGRAAKDEKIILIGHGSGCYCAGVAIEWAI